MIKFKTDVLSVASRTRIHFKHCVLVYKSLHGVAPAYIAELRIKRCCHSERYRLRSAVSGELVVPPKKKQLSGVEVSSTLAHL